MAKSYEQSDHYDGKRFFNPTLETQFSPSLADIIAMLREGRQAWPRDVKNKPAAPIPTAVAEDGLAITFINHATFLIQLPGLTILTDPVWSQRVSPFRWLGPKRVKAPGIDLEALPKIDLVLISHNHYDHLDVATIRKLTEQHEPHFLAPLGVRALLERIGVKAVEELDWWDSRQVSPDVEVTLTPAQHSSGRGLFDRNRTLWGSYYIQGKERRVYFGADGGYSSHFAEIGARLGAPDVAMLGIGAYEPRSFMTPIHTNPAEAVQAHKDLGARVSIGMHYGTFQLASEGYHQPGTDLDQALAAHHPGDGSFILLPEGQVMHWREAE